MGTAPSWSQRWIKLYNMCCMCQILLDNAVNLITARLQMTKVPFLYLMYFHYYVLLWPWNQSNPPLLRTSSGSLIDLFHPDILTCHSRKSTRETNNNGCFMTILCGGIFKLLKLDVALKCYYHQKGNKLLVTNNHTSSLLHSYHFLWFVYCLIHEVVRIIGFGSENKSGAILYFSVLSANPVERPQLTINVSY